MPPTPARRCGSSIFVGFAFGLSAIGCVSVSDGPVVGTSPADEGIVVNTREIEYRDGDTVLRGLFAWPANASGPVPGVVVVHQWRGRGPSERRRAGMLAELGYAAFAIDMYGDGVFVEDAGSAATRSGAMLANRDAMTTRFEAGWNTLKAQPEVDPRTSAAIGYCFGGTVVLEMARRGLELDAVTSFHGALFFPRTPPKDLITADVLVCNGYLDPMVPPEVATTFMAQMSEAGADWTFIDYGGAVHAFTDELAGAPRHGARTAHDPRADRRSWAAMIAQFEDRLGPPDPEPFQTETPEPSP